MLDQLIRAIQRQTDVWPVVYKTPGGPFALYHIDEGGQLARTMTPEYRQLHNVRVEVSLVELETALRLTTQVLLIGHKPGCLEFEYRLGSPSPELEARYLNEILSQVGPAVRRKAQAMGCGEIKIWTMSVDLTDTKVSRDPFGSLLQA